MSLYVGQDLSYTHKMTIVFVTGFLGAVIVYFIMYAILGFGGGMIVPLRKSDRKKITFI